MKLQELLEKYGNVDIAEIPVEEELDVEIDNLIEKLRDVFNDCNDKFVSYLYKNGEFKITSRDRSYEGLFVLSSINKMYYFDEGNYVFDTIERKNISPTIAYYICERNYDYSTIEEMIDAISNYCDSHSETVEEFKELINSFTRFMNELDSE